MQTTNKWQFVKIPPRRNMMESLQFPLLRVECSPLWFRSIGFPPFLGKLNILIEFPHCHSCDRESIFYAKFAKKRIDTCCGKRIVVILPRTWKRFSSKANSRVELQSQLRKMILFCILSERCRVRRLGDQWTVISRNLSMGQMQTMIADSVTPFYFHFL